MMSLGETTATSDEIDRNLAESFDRLEEALKALSVCAACRGLEHCKFDRGMRPVVQDDYGLWRDMGAVYVSQKPCHYLEQQRRLERIEAQWNNAGIPKRFRGCRFSNFKLVEGSKRAYELSRKYAMEFDHETTKGLYFLGDVGAGKTHLAISILRTVIEKGHSGKFLMVPRWLDQIRASFNRKYDDQPTTDEVAAEFKFPGLLVVDDIGSENPSEWVREQIFLGVDERYTNMLPTIFTSNLTPEELEDRLGKRTVSRIIEMCDGVLVEAADYRKRKLVGTA